MVSHVHGCVDQHEKHFDVDLVETGKQLGISAHEQSKRFAVCELIVTPLKEPLEDRVEAALGVSL